jgi:hypothetical protein
MQNNRASLGPGKPPNLSSSGLAASSANRRRAAMPMSSKSSDDRAMSVGRLRGRKHALGDAEFDSHREQCKPTPRSDVDTVRIVRTSSVVNGPSWSQKRTFSRGAHRALHMLDQGARRKKWWASHLMILSSSKKTVGRARANFPPAWPF